MAWLRGRATALICCLTPPRLGHGEVPETWTFEQSGSAVRFFSCGRLRILPALAGLGIPKRSMPFGICPPLCCLDRPLCRHAAGPGSTRFAALARRGYYLLLHHNERCISLKHDDLTFSCYLQRLRPAKERDRKKIPPAKETEGGALHRLRENRHAYLVVEDTADTTRVAQHATPSAP